MKVKPDGNGYHVTPHTDGEEKALLEWLQPRLKRGSWASPPGAKQESPPAPTPPKAREG